MKPPFEEPHPPDNLPEEAVMGHAFRWAVVALFLMIIAGGVLFVVNMREERAVVPMQPAKAGPAKNVFHNLIPKVEFTDATAEAGITFQHVNGARGEKLLPETMGSGVAFLDFDNDGDQDLLFINSTYWPGGAPDGAKPATAALYRNDRGKFTDVTAGSGLDVSLYGMGVAVGDYDNDGLVDVFITAVGGNRLFNNLGGGRFRDATTAAGVSGSTEQWSTSAAWMDYDNDGDLDLFVCNYVRWSRAIDLEVNYQLPGVGRAYGPPMHFAGAFPSLYRNDGQGRFTDVSAAAGVQVKNNATGLPLAKSLGVAPVDMNDDGFMDLIVANDTVQNFVFQNQRNGTFKEVGAASGIAYDTFGGTRGAMGIDSGRFQDDSSLGVLIGNYANEMTALYVSQQRHGPVFTDEAINQGIGSATRLSLTFGVFFFDYDLDGRLDLLTANGHIEEQIEKTQPGQNYRQPVQLFWNARDTGKSAGYVQVPPGKCGPDLLKPIVGRGAAYADMDGDGDLDVVVTQLGGPPLLLRNEQKLGHHWVRFKLTGNKSNRDAIGAWVKLRIGQQILSQQVMPTRGYLSQSELPVTFGLGFAANVNDVTIIWPGGEKQKVEKVRVDAVNRIEQP